MKIKLGRALVMMFLGLPAAVHGSEYNFYEQADKKGCASIITERGQDECARTQRAKDDACNVPYDRATDEMRAVEKALEQFNIRYGKDIERYASRLIEQYKAERESHERPLSEAKNRVENCKKVDNMSY